jgi:alpha-amylase
MNEEQIQPGNDSKAIVLYLHVHQPFRIRHYTIFDTGQDSNYFDSHHDSKENNERILHKVAAKSYIPANRRFMALLNKHPEFKISLSITGTVLEQMERWAPAALKSFQDLVATGRVEIVAETYHHSLAFFYSLSEFEMQVRMHREKIESLFGQTPTVFRNTELSYNNDLATWAERSGYKGILAEGWDPVLGWRSPNFVYEPINTENLKLLTKNYKLSDDLAFRFGDREWSEWPLTADKFAHWLNETHNGTNFNLFMDYETFGEHQWEESGIFDFLEHLPGEWLKRDGNTFMTVSEAMDSFKPADKLDMPYTVTWADTERDLSAWLGNPMQQQAITALYDLQDKILSTDDWELIEHWRKLQTSDHFYYMCTKWFNDGDIHAYFSPYDTPYEAFTNFMNAWHDLRYRLAQKGIEV